MTTFDEQSQFVDIAAEGRIALLQKIHADEQRAWADSVEALQKRVDKLESTLTEIASGGGCDSCPINIARKALEGK